MKQSKSIDALVTWAYDELGKLQSSSADGIWDRIGFGSDRTAYHSGSAQRYDFGLPHPDSDVVVKAVDELDDCQIDWQTHHKAIMGPFDALFMAHDVILTETVRPSALIRFHAIMRSRPAWGRDYEPFPSRIQPARGPAGSAAIVGECRGAGKYTAGSYCPLKWVPSVIELARQRANYVGWHDGLGRLCQTLRNGRLEAFEPTAPECASEPWNHSESAPRVLRDTISRPLTKLPDHWQRPVASRRPQMRLGAAYPA